jgi:hypothetical protein
VPRIDGRALFSTVAVRRPPRFSALAAGIALACAAAAAAAAVPNSPVRLWLESLIGTARSGEQQAAVSPPAEPERQKAKGAGGISIVPVHKLEITFLGNQESGEIRVAFRDDERVSVQSTEAGPAYAIQKDRIVVNNAGSTASYEIGLPRALSTARISIASDIVFRSEAGTVSSEARPDREGRYIIPLMSRLRRAP